MCKRRLLFLAWGVALLSCSVKEKREDCPCRLEIDLSAYTGGEPQLRLWSERKALVIGALTGSLWQSDVPKDTYRLSVLDTGEECRAEILLDRVVWPEGAEADSLYAYAETLPCHGEQFRTTALRWKQFCSVTLREKERTGLRYAVRSGTGAFAREDLRPLPAPLSFEARREDDGSVRFRLPRQGDGSELRLIAEEADGSRFELPLGDWMEEAGYDWQQPSLDDFSLEIDYTASEVRIAVLDWESDDPLILKI